MSYISKFDLIPGYREAVTAEMEYRDADFLSNTTYIYGVEVHKLTPRLMCILTLMKHPLMVGGDLTLLDVVSFIWVVSTQFTTDDVKRKEFLDNISKRILDEKGAVEAVMEDITGYIKKSFEDGSGKSRLGDANNSVSCYATITDIFAHEYGWDEEKVFNLPFRRIFQYLRAITLRNNPKAVFDNPSDKVVVEFQGKLNA
jgi:hypothetical protein